MKRKPQAGWNAGNVVFRAALEPLEAAMLPAGERAPHQAHLPARSAETGENRVGAAGTRRRSAAENLGQINIAVLIQRHADADLGIARA